MPCATRCQRHWRGRRNRCGRPAAGLSESICLELCGTISGMCCLYDESQIVRGEEEGRDGHISGRTLFSLVVWKHRTGGRLVDNWRGCSCSLNFVH